ncbi:hypothetical protein DFH06DRAFT_1329479 [Mycena polygramma]|nr:hypothetical protein DFH06DRAFT_1329479 [Mycena polygramma]
MLASATSNDLKGKNRLLKKANRLSRRFMKEFVAEMDGNARALELLEPSSSEIETTANWASWSLPHVPLAVARRDSSQSTIEDPSTATSSEAGSRSASTEHLRRGKSRLSRQLEENIPPASAKRRQSFDLSVRSGSTSPQDLKRSHSLRWEQQKRKEVLDDASDEFQDRYLRNFGTGTMSERQRALAVKRARKMTQLFGQEPPSELIHIHDERDSTESTDHSRDSTATLSNLLTAPLRDRANSTSSTGTTAHDAEIDDEILSNSPPFSTLHALDTPELPSSTTFQERRRRAAKLSRFFGVGYQDISEVAPVPEPEASVEVGVKIGGGRRFWSFSDRPRDVDDMQEAIQKLRGLKAG